MAAAPTVRSTAFTGIDAHYYLVKDLKRAIAFWRDIIGLPVTFEFEQGAEFELPDGSTFGLYRMHDGTWTPGSGIMFAVADAPQTADHYRKRGVKVDEHIEDTPVCLMAFAEDSEGNRFIIHQRKPQ